MFRDLITFLGYFIDKINVSKIIKNHVSTLRNVDSVSLSRYDCVLFFGVPFLLSILATIFNIKLNKDLIGVLINVFAIFAGLLFNLLVLIYDVISKQPSVNNSSSKYIKNKFILLKEIYYNVSFGIFLSLFVVIALAASIISLDKLNTFFSFIIFGLSTLFILTLLMILKRIHNLLSFEIDQQSKL